LRVSYICGTFVFSRFSEGRKTRKMRITRLTALFCALLFTPAWASAVEADIEQALDVSFNFNLYGNLGGPDLRGEDDGYAVNAVPFINSGFEAGISPLSITCTGEGGDKNFEGGCGEFVFDLFGYSNDFDGPIDTLKYDVTIDGTLQAESSREFLFGFGFYGYDDDFNQTLPDESFTDNVTIFPGDFSMTLFSGSVDATGTTNISFFGNITGMLGLDEALLLPDSFNIFAPGGAPDTGAIPEPSTIALLLGGVAALGLLRRKQR